MYPDICVGTSISINRSGNNKNIQQMFNISVWHTESHLYHHLVVQSQKTKNVSHRTVNSTAQLSKSFLA